jgi:hypothetical protein
MVQNILSQYIYIYIFRLEYNYENDFDDGLDPLKMEITDRN